MEFDDDISNSLAAELTGSIGFSDDDLNAEGGMVPADLADDVEDYDDQALRRDAHLQSDDEAVQAEALQQERQQLDLQSQQLEAQRQQMAAVQMQQLAMQRIALEQQRQAALEAQIPAFEEDPEGHVAAKFRLQELRAQEAAQAEQHRQQFQQQTAEFARHAAEVAPVAGALEQEFIEQHLNGDADAYRQSFDFMFERADREIRVRYPGLPEEGYQTMRAVAGMALLEQCAAQNINPAQYVHSRAHELGFRANGRAPHSAQRQPATLEQLAGMNDKQFKQAMKQPKQPRNGAQPDVDRMDDATFNEMFESMKQSSAGNRFGFGD
jgi:hypothetical protein